MNSVITPLKDELKQFFIIAIPLSAAYLAEFAMFITTKMVVGKLGYHSLAAVGIAGDLTFEVLVILMATLLRAAPPLCSASVLSPLWFRPLGFLPCHRDDWFPQFLAKAHDRFMPPIRRAPPTQ